MTKFEIDDPVIVIKTKQKGIVTSIDEDLPIMIWVTFPSGDYSWFVPEELKLDEN